MEGHQGGVDDYRNDRQVEVVKHDVGVLVDASLEAKVQTKRAPADILQRAWLFWPVAIETEETALVPRLEERCKGA